MVLFAISKRIRIENIKVHIYHWSILHQIIFIMKYKSNIQKNAERGDDVMILRTKLQLPTSKMFLLSIQGLLLTVLFAILPRVRVLKMRPPINFDIEVEYLAESEGENSAIT